jgi:hypothetical protein
VSLAQVAPLVPYLLLVAVLAGGRAGCSASVSMVGRDAERRAALDAVRRMRGAAGMAVAAGRGTRLSRADGRARRARAVVQPAARHDRVLSFGHAAVAGVGAFAAAHWFNRVGAPLPLLPLVGGVAGAAFGCVAGLLATRRAGTVFAMITLGIGECVAAAASVPAWFGGVGGVPIDRAGGTPWGGWQFGAPTHAYALIAAWCIGSALAMSR